MISSPAILLVLVALWLLLTEPPSTAAECPSDCVCMWKNGKETTECINRDKDAIPPGIEPSTQVLDLRGNNIRVLRNDLFLTMGITNLQRIYCSYCKISEVEPKAFRRLTNLVELDLSENAMREVPSEAWKHAKALMRLNLSGNPIKLIRSGAFQKLQFVTNLALSHCEVETLELGAFDGMDSLADLKLESNKLNYLQGSGLFPKSLHHLQIHDNPFRCDCRLLDFSHWVQTSGIPRGVEPTCHSPLRLQNRTLTSLDLQELACLPQVSPASTPPASNTIRLSLSSPASEFSVKETPAGKVGSGGGYVLTGRDASLPREEPTDDVSIVESVVGKNVSLRCTVFGIPSASVSWWHDNRLVSNGSKLEHAWEDQYYSIAEYKTNAHQLVSEFVILFVRLQDDEGAFYCAAQNPAGVARANFSIRVIEVVGTGGGNHSTSPSDPKNSGHSDGDSNMFKVEYILGFGAAAVIVLTIIIVLILYIILQCRSHRRKHRAALRAAGLPCDSNSGSFMERSTVDFIVPGEMELTSAVRSVSGNNSNTMATKCLNPNQSGSNGMLHASGSLGRQGSSKHATTKDDGSGHEGDDEDEYGGGHGMTKTASTSLASSSAGSLHKSSGYHLAPMQTAQGHLESMYPRQYPMMNGYMPGGCNSWQPPGYRHPPPPPVHGYIFNKSSVCHCCGEFQMPPTQYFGPMVPFHQQRPVYAANYMGGGVHFKNCPRAGNIALTQPSESDREQFRLSGANQLDHYLIANSANHQPQYSMIQRQFQVHPQFQNFPTKTDWAPVGILRNGNGRQFEQNVERQHFRIPPTPCSDQEDFRYGAYSDGEADRVSKTINGGYGGPRNCRNKARRQSTSSYCGSTSVDLPPHYVTMSRTMSKLGFQQRIDQNRFQSDPCSGRFTPHSQPPDTHHLVLHASKESLNKANGLVKPVKFNVQKPMPAYQQPVSQQPNRIADDEYLFPDLPPPPDALLEPAPSEQAFFQIANGQPVSSFQNSRSSSLDDLQWVTSAADMTSRMDMNDGFHHKSNTLPSDGRDARGRSPIIKQSATGSKVKSCSSGAVRIDLSTADKSIRRPGSAPELAVKRPGSPVRSALRRQQNGSSSRQPEVQETLKNGVTLPHQHMSTRVSGLSETSSKRVMFKGVSDGDSPSESQDDVWVLREDQNPDDNSQLIEDSVPVTGVVVARPQLACRVMQPQQYVMPRVESLPNPHLTTSITGSHPLGSPNLSGGPSSTSPRRALCQTAPPALLPRASTLPQTRPPPPPPPPRTTPTSRPVNPALQRPSLQPRGNFHESPDEGYHEDDAGSEVL